MNLKGGMLSAYNLLLGSTDKEFPVTRWRVDFLKRGQSLQLIGLFTSGGVHGMFKGKGYHCIYMLSSFIPHM